VWREQYADGLGGLIAQSFETFKKAGGQQHSIARDAAARIREARANDLIYPEGRERLVREARAKAEQDLADLRRQQDAALKLLRASLEVRALPGVPSDREMTVRDEVRMILDNAPDPLSAALDLAQSRNDMAALLTSRWGESYLRAKGIKQAPQLHEQVRNVALAANIEHPDAEVALAASGLASITELQKGLACQRATSSHVVESALEDTAQAATQAQMNQAAASKQLGA
jgi:hypothetical protein